MPSCKLLNFRKRLDLYRFELAKLMHIFHCGMLPLSFEDMFQKTLEGYCILQNMQPNKTFKQQSSTTTHAR